MRTLGSVVIPAHDEAAVIERCLDALLDDLLGAFEVVVVCNGCTDDTAERARDYPVKVLELTEPSKAAALRAGDATATVFPRLYLDADVVLTARSAAAVLALLAAGGAPAARPPLAYETAGASAPVRGYYRARSRLPAVLGSLWGAGVYGVSAAGRSRFGAFPDLVGDDLWVDGHFAPGEVAIVDCPPVLVRVPRRSADLVRVLRRTYRGNAEQPSGGTSGGTAATVRDLRLLARGGPAAALDATTYAVFAVWARAALRLYGRPAPRWERDDSARLG